MTTLGQPEHATQNRIVALFRDELGYRYLDDWTDRDGNSNIEQGLLTDHLTKCGYTPPQIGVALHKLRTEADNHSRTVYGNNQAVYNLLRYGVPVKIEAGKVTETVHIINWHDPEKNDFAIAEEVTLRGNRERRPDLVLYVNGIAIGVLELKNSRVSIGDGVRQSLSNQQPEFNAWFFSTVQFIFAGNDSEGLQYGTIGTPEKLFLKWKEDEADNSRFKLEKYLLRICRKDRLIELMNDFVLFDGGVKKLPRAHQYFGVKAAQAHVREKKGGIIWHAQGSGKSIVMVLLAKWILENNPNARVAIITDRDELDKQIEGVFTEAGEAIKRTSSGRDLMSQLGQAKPRLLCSLVHKFGRKDVDDLDAFIKELEAQPSSTVGEVFVFVDECHRTQSGKLHRVMKAMMPNAVFIGFTGTPLLAKDRATSLEVFGGYIHTYKFSEGVEDGVVLDLVYEARDIDQRLGSEDKIDAWFEAKTKGLNDWQKDELKKQWGTMQNVPSSRSRMDRVVSDIIFDFSVKPRLSSERGNAILVASSIHEACKYFTLFQKTPFKGKCAVVTSYNPLARDVTLEETGANTETDRQFIYNTYTELLKDVDAKPGMTKTETYEEQARALFTEEPANMKLLVVVDKLLTGFDAPPCTYLYIDKSMQDHGLFQAICRVNRLDVEFKNIKNVHLSVYPPKGRVRISAPKRMSMETIRVFAISKLGWIKQQQQKLREQQRETSREYVDRESHYVWGKRYLLTVSQSDEPPSIELRHSRMLLRVRPRTDEDRRQALVEEWYREQLKAAVLPLLARWQPLLGVRVERFFVQRMKTKWGSCNHKARTIRLNTELAKKPAECLEYIVVHELVHLLEPTHNARFLAVMDRFMPNWQFHRQVLNRLPVRREKWSY